MIPDSNTPHKPSCIHDVSHYRQQGRSKVLTIPKTLSELLDWKEGELVVISAMNNSLVILPVRSHMIDQLEKYVQESQRIH